MVAATAYYCGVVLQQFLRPLVFAVLFAMFLRPVQQVVARSVNAMLTSTLQANGSASAAALRHAASAVAALGVWRTHASARALISGGGLQPALILVALNIGVIHVPTKHADTSIYT